MNNIGLITNQINEAFLIERGYKRNLSGSVAYHKGNVHISIDTINASGPDYFKALVQQLEEKNNTFKFGVFEYE